VQGPTLRAFCNEQELAALHDPSIGIGQVAIGVYGPAPDKCAHRALVRWLEMREVIA
jgi:hypothetical protein